MSTFAYELHIPGPVSADLVSLCTRDSSSIIEDRPSKRRKIQGGNSRFNVDNAAKYLPQYLRFTEQPDDNVEYGTSTRVPVNLRRRRSGVHRLFSLELQTRDTAVSLDAHDLESAPPLLNLIFTIPSIYRIFDKVPTACYQALLHRDPADNLSFHLEVKVLWNDSPNLPGRCFGDAKDAFAQCFPSEHPRPTDSELSEVGQWTPNEFYSSVHVPKKQVILSLVKGFEAIKSQLFPFQERALGWLLEREGVEVLPDGTLRPVVEDEGLPLSFERTTDAEGRPCFVSHAFCIAISDLSKWPYSTRVRGGVLAEEMGLGKTVELLSLICIHRRPQSAISAPDSDSEPVASGATLIIAPAAILEQWKQEITKQAPNLRFMHYQGIHLSKVSDDVMVQQLASHDIVLTTYAVLQREVHFAQDPPDRPLRNQRRLPRRKSPIVQISWWRVCIDEAQMVETGASNAARVARIIPRCNAWAVTGTPLRKDMRDLFGLLLFLRYEPFCSSLETWVRICELFKPAKKNELVRIPLMATDFRPGGIESQRILERLEDFSEAMNQHTIKFNKWRDHMVKLILRPLVDEEDSTNPEGNEYESSTKVQDEMYVYMETLRAMVANHHDAITGQTSALVSHELKQALEKAKTGNGPSPNLFISLMEACEKLKVPRELGSLRGILNELRTLVTSLEWQESGGSSRARAELGIVEELHKTVSKLFSTHSKIASKLEREILLFQRVTNRRLEYYRHLQQISDTVAPYAEESKGQPLDKEQFDSKLRAEEKMKAKLSGLKAKRRYLVHLREDAGVLTVCGHKYCKDCLGLWWRQHRSCPACKSRLHANELHQITYKPAELVAQEEKAPGNLETHHSMKNAIYSDIKSDDLEEIKDIEISGSFGTKIDTLARHLIWLRHHDPGAKSIVFSQYKSFLGILASAFSRFRIEFSSFDSYNGIERFKQDPSIECFLLHAKAHSSGLNLVNATHVFLCEPLINTAIELQAIARVHRIGQHRETTVWMYLVSDSVEESIYQLSVSRRLAHIAQKRKELDKSGTGFLVANGDDGLDLSNLNENVIDAANSLEMQDAALGKLLRGRATEGENVDDNDLWQCLFGKVKKNGTGSGGAIEHMRLEVDRMLRADAAEGRRDANN
ncbi:DNA repair protein rad5 [Coccidioides immitis H538.4]|uniref:DNA repair protein rad5 n=1 Tax=Coccidioides immitis H538.4 TaxID=396776 RepID=A0A0J8RVD7_COCIT|nr:DNA repair protein rad5 [Coccidioides immitis H538.4]